MNMYKGTSTHIQENLVDRCCVKKLHIIKYRNDTLSEISLQMFIQSNPRKLLKMLKN